MGQVMAFMVKFILRMGDNLDKNLELIQRQMMINIEQKLQHLNMADLQQCEKVIVRTDQVGAYLVNFMMKMDNHEAKNLWSMKKQQVINGIHPQQHYKVMVLLSFDKVIYKMEVDMECLAKNLQLTILQKLKTFT